MQAAKGVWQDALRCHSDAHTETAALMGRLTPVQRRGLVLPDSCSV